MLLSGYVFPIDQMPTVVQDVTYLVHARYYVTIVKAIFLKGADISALALPTVFLLIYATGVMALAAVSQEARLSMLGRVSNILIKEFIQPWRDKWGRVRLIVPPLIQLLLFGYAATFEAYHVSTAVLDLDHSQGNRELVAGSRQATVSGSSELPRPRTRSAA